MPSTLRNIWKWHYLIIHPTNVVLALFIVCVLPNKSSQMSWKERSYPKWKFALNVWSMLTCNFFQFCSLMLWMIMNFDYLMFMFSCFLSSFSFLSFVFFFFLSQLQVKLWFHTLLRLTWGNYPEFDSTCHPTPWHCKLLLFIYSVFVGYAASCSIINRHTTVYVICTKHSPINIF